MEQVFFQPVTNYLAALEAKHQRDLAAEQLKDAQTRNRLNQMRLALEEGQGKIDSAIAAEASTPKTVYGGSVKMPAVADIGNLHSVGGQPVGWDSTNPRPLPAMSPEQNIPFSGASPEAMGALKGALIPAAEIQQEESQITPLIEQAKALGVNLPSDILATPDGQLAAYRFVQAKKAEHEELIKRDLGYIDKIKDIDGHAALRAFNANPGLVNRFGKMDVSDYGDIKEYKVGDKTISYGIKTPDGKWTQVKPDDLTEWQRAMLEQRALDRAQRRDLAEIKISVGQDATNPDDFANWAPEEQKQAYLRSIITGKGGRDLFATRDKKNLANFSHGLQKFQLENGYGPGVVARMQADYKAGDKSLSNQRKIYDMSTSFVTNLNGQIGKVKEIYSQLPRTQTKLLNIPIRELRMRAKGSGEEAAAASYLLEISNEIGKLSTGSAASIRELSESAQRQWAKIHDGTLPMKDIIIVLDATKDQANMRLQAQYDAMQATSKFIDEMGTVPSSKPGRVKVDPSQIKIIGQ